MVRVSRSSLWRLWLCIASAAIVLAVDGRVAAQSTQGAAVAGAEAPVVPKPKVRIPDELDRGTPRSTMRAYLNAARENDWERAANYINLRPVEKGERASKGPDLARQLKVVLDRTLWVDLASLSDEPGGHREDGLPPSRDFVGTIQSEKGAVDLYVDRIRQENGVSIWKVSPVTVVRIPELHEEFGYGPLGELLPPVLFEIQLIDVALWQWVGLFVLVLLSALLSWLITTIVLRIAHPLVRHWEGGYDDHLIRLIGGPVRLIVAVAMFYAGSLPLALGLVAHSFVQSTSKALVIVGVTWLMLRITEIVAQVFSERWTQRSDTGAVALLPLGRKTVKVFLVVLAVIAVLQNLGFNVTGIIAGLGVGGLAVALAAQKTVENLFGAVTLTADQPVRVGDFCRFGDRLGTVEDIGLRSTRIRTLDRTVISVPNSEFANMQLESFAKRDRIWFSTKIGVRYETGADQLRYLLVELKKMLLAHPRVSPDPARVRFTGFGDYSLDIEFFAYILTSDINEFHAIREDLLLRIMEVVEASGTGFAFPSSTTYLARDGGLNEERGRAAAAQVQAWREKDELCLPDFPPDQAALIDDTLDYPPRGSVRPAPAIINQSVRGNGQPS